MKCRPPNLHAATDGTRVWDLETMKSIHSPSSPGIRGATTAISWIKRDDDPGEALFYGTQEGYLVCWRQGAGVPDFEEVSVKQIANPGEITGLAFDSMSNHIAVCNRNGVVQVYTLDSSMNLRLVYSSTIVNSSPKAIAFGATYGGSERDILVFNMYSGNIHLLRNLEVAATWDLGGFIGDASVDSRKGSMCIDDPSCGVNVYRLEDNGHRKVKSFSIPVTKEVRARKVSYANQCQEIVGGSDHGKIYVFGRCNGETIDELRIDPSEWVQTITATECNGVPTILAAKSRVTTPNEIYVWRKRSERRRVAGLSCSMTMCSTATEFSKSTITSGMVVVKD
ncbi:hypothetical protein B0H13DRAFT_1887172 [Mycena leptocephala]|nr:hypothetical protein B0H13DRAFT_1887172 [Mycena leptocephala]